MEGKISLGLKAVGSGVAAAGLEVTPIVSDDIAAVLTLTWTGVGVN